MNHRIDKLTALLDGNETQQNVTIESAKTIECENIIKVEPLLIPQSNRFKVTSSC